MRVISHLIQHKAALETPRACSFFMSIFQPTIYGKFEDYDAKFGIMYQRFMCPGILFYKVRLKRTQPIPILLWDQCPITNSEFSNLEIHNRLWLTTCFYDIPEPPLLGAKRYLEKQTVEAIKKEFLNLVKVARKLDQGEIRLDKVITRSKKEFAKEIIITIFITLLVVPLVYWWLYHT